MSYVIWRSGDEGNTAQLESLLGWDDAWKLQEGVSVVDEFPVDAHYRMDPNHPKRTRLSDCLGNRNGLPVISNRLKAFLEAKQIDGVEFLPTGIVNHKGRETKERYWILNATRVVDCLDTDASEVVYSPFDGTIDLMQRMSLRQDAIDEGTTMFRVANVPGPTLLRTELADELDAEGFTALYWRDPAKHRG